MFSRVLRWLSREVRSLEAQNCALRRELSACQRALKLAGTNEDCGSPKPPVWDGWREIEVGLDGRLVMLDEGGILPMTLDEARTRMPDWEFREELKDGQRRVWAR